MRERLMRMVSAIWNVLNKGYTIIKGYLYLYFNILFSFHWTFFKKHKTLKILGKAKDKNLRKIIYPC